MSADGGAWFVTVSSEIVHDGHVTMRQDRVRTPDGDEVLRDVAQPPDGVAVVAVLDGREVVLVRQHRQPIGASVLELPAGVRDVDGESAIEVGLRELTEEVGMTAGRAEELTTLVMSPGWSTERLTLVLATELRPAERPASFEPEAEEAVMEVVRLPLAAAVDAVRDGTITDAKTVVGLLLADARVPA